ncbi:MAG: porphobilinogen synthase [Pseudomonadota bacterium]
MVFPQYRGRRLRRNERLRRLVRETRLSVEQLVYPLFALEGNVVKPIDSMPGMAQLPLKQLVEEAKAARDLGISGVLLFGIPDKKDDLGRQAYAPNGIVQRATRRLKEAVPDLLIITDVCLCEYTSHGHCGQVIEGEVDNDATLDLLAKTALSHAQAGADIVAPSDMMDGRVGEIREALDEGGFEQVPIMSYAVKYAYSFYGPFREAAESTPQFGDRRSYQMDPPNALEALREAAMDVEEGADILMVKPALPYLDIVWRLREEFDLPLAAYHVSGEYAAIKAAGQLGWLDAEAAIMESLISIRRAGADIIITYGAKEAARLLAKNQA